MCPQCKSPHWKDLGLQPFSTMRIIKCISCGHKTRIGRVAYQALKAKGAFLPILQKQVDRLKKVRGLDKDEFIYGIHSSKLKVCPGCSEKLCHWIGGGPGDVECLNNECDFFKLPANGKRIFYGWEKPYGEKEN